MTLYADKIASTISKIRAKGQLVHYMPALRVVTPNNPAQPWRVGVVAAGQTDPNAAPAAYDVYMVFVKAKARGSDTQGNIAVLVQRTDVVGGNKGGLLAGGQGITPVIGDVIDRNTEGRAGYPLYKVAKIDNVDIDGAPILWTLELEL